MEYVYGLLGILNFAIWTSFFRK